MAIQDKIRNFCIIAHIDHGKSTLADRLLEITGTVEKRSMQEQVLDSMDIERERGITIKLAPVQMKHIKGGVEYVLNLIDTPGHVDFHYEVSRSLAAVEGAILLVDATQGVQAQTLANLYLAIEQGLEIIPVLNKIDLPAADVPARKQELMQLLGCSENDILSVSAKTGENVENLLDVLVDKIPPPTGKEHAPARALVFDSYYDDYKGVVAYVRVIDGGLRKRDNLKMMATGAVAEILDVGFLVPKFSSSEVLTTGQIGYVVTGLKELGGCRVGDTMTLDNAQSVEALPGYKEVKPMVFAGIFPQEGDDYAALRDAMERLKLNDSALIFEPEHSPALGYGFRVGFLGMLHLEILKERLEREFGINLIVTVPSVAYKVLYKNGEEKIVKSPLDLPSPSHLEKIEEPWAKLDIIVPVNFIGAVMTLAQDRHGIYKNTEFLSEGRAILKYEIPLSSLIVDFYDKLKSVSSGFASMNYEVFAYRSADVVRMDILVAEEPVEALSTFVYRDEAHKVGKKIIHTLKESIPRQQFVIKLQAAVGGAIVAGDRLSAYRKDVTAKLYGGDVTRKRKLLEKQKKGKKR
ncbi:elongation factor 4, partial [Candidatus Parcubacteria bacterium]